MFARAVGQALAMVALACGSAYAQDPARPSRVLTGQWGGEHVVLTMSKTATHVELDCAHGDLSSPIRTDPQRRFTIAGTFVRERGGPVRRDAPLDRHAATYEGSVRANTMTLTIRLKDSDELIGTFILKRGAAGRLVKCRHLAR